MLEISKIKIDGTQSRVEINQATLQEYSDAIADGVDFPPVIVFYDGADYWLADGFHRLLAHNRAGKQKIFETVILGSKRDAILYSVGANHSHGLRRTNDDKKKSALMLLQDGEWSKLTDSEIADKCNLSRQFISKLRNEQGEKPAEKTVTRNGKTYQQNTANIGRKPEERTAGDVMRDVLSPSPKPKKQTFAEQQEAYRAAKKEEEYEDGAERLTPEQELQIRVEYLEAELDIANAALADFDNAETAGYMSELKKMQINLEAVTLSRDILQNENAAYKRAEVAKDKKIKKLYAEIDELKARMPL
jgi:hypothetical protein